MSDRGPLTEQHKLLMKVLATYTATIDDTPNYCMTAFAEPTARELHAAKDHRDELAEKLKEMAEKLNALELKLERLHDHVVGMQTAYTDDGPALNALLERVDRLEAAQAGGNNASAAQDVVAILNAVKGVQ